VARRSTSSEQHPGPSAISSPWLPGAGGRSRRVSASTCRTEAEERLPIAAEDARVSARSTSVSPRVSRSVDDLGPAGVADPPADVGPGQAVIGQEPVDVLADITPDDSGHLGVEHDPQAQMADVEAHRPFTVGIEPTTTVQHRDRAGPAPAAPSAPPIAAHRTRWCRTTIGPAHRRAAEHGSP
jgi:hypothetical protein